MRRTVNCLDLEIKKIGVQMILRKCNIIMKYEPQYEIETYETYDSILDKKVAKLPDNVTYTNRAA